MKSSEDKVLNKAKSAKRESKEIEFKAEFHPRRRSDWCELIKDIVSMANSGGGCLLIGVKDNGRPSGSDIAEVLTLDAAKITDKIAKYTDRQFAGFDISELERAGHRIAALRVNGVCVPMVFVKPGTYDAGGGKQKTAFAKGTVYFRHGAKSEPGNSDDLRRSLERELERVKESWLGNIKKVVDAPVGYDIQMVPAGTVASTMPSAPPVRVVDDEAAAVYGRIYADVTHPYRQKEVLRSLNERLEGKKKINAYDMLSVRTAHRIDETKREYFYKPRFGSPQYSEAFVDWVVEQYRKDGSFFDAARRKYRSQRLREAPD